MGSTGVILEVTQSHDTARHTARPPIKGKPENTFLLDDWNQANPSPRNTFDFVTQRALAQGAIDEARLGELTDSIASGVCSKTEVIRELCALLCNLEVA